MDTNILKRIFFDHNNHWDHFVEKHDQRFRYYDKTEEKEKTESVSVEEFMARLIRHIPDEQFKTIRHYGIYSRRIKSISKKLATIWQESVKRWIVKTKKVIRRKSWREKIIESTGKDPMVCPKCECYYEYKGEVCLEEGVLQIKYAVCATSRAVMERMIEDLTSIQTPETREEKEEKPKTETERAVKDQPSQIHLFAM